MHGRASGTGAGAHSGEGLGRQRAPQPFAPEWWEAPAEAPGGGGASASNAPPDRVAHGCWAETWCAGLQAPRRSERRVPHPSGPSLALPTLAPPMLLPAPSARVPTAAYPTATPGPVRMVEAGLGGTRPHSATSPTPCATCGTCRPGRSGGTGDTGSASDHGGTGGSGTWGRRYDRGDSSAVAPRYRAREQEVLAGPALRRTESAFHVAGCADESSGFTPSPEPRGAGHAVQREAPDAAATAALEAEAAALRRENAMLRQRLANAHQTVASPVPAPSSGAAGGSSWTADDGGPSTSPSPPRRVPALAERRSRPPSTSPRPPCCGSACCCRCTCGGAGAPSHTPSRPEPDRCGSCGAGRRAARGPVRARAASCAACTTPGDVAPQQWRGMPCNGGWAIPPSQRHAQPNNLYPKASRRTMGRGSSRSRLRDAQGLA